MINHRNKLRKYTRADAHPALSPLQAHSRTIKLSSSHSVSQHMKHSGQGVVLLRIIESSSSGAMMWLSPCSGVSSWIYKRVRPMNAMRFWLSYLVRMDAIWTKFRRILVHRIYYRPLHPTVKGAAINSLSDSKSEFGRCFNWQRLRALFHISSRPPEF